MVADMAAERKIFFLADMLLHMMADKVADKVAATDWHGSRHGDRQKKYWLTWSSTGWPTNR